MWRVWRFCASNVDSSRFLLDSHPEPHLCLPVCFSFLSLLSQTIEAPPTRPSATWVFRELGLLPPMTPLLPLSPAWLVSINRWGPPLPSTFQTSKEIQSSDTSSSTEAMWRWRESAHTHSHTFWCTHRVCCSQQWSTPVSFFFFFA